MRDVILVMAILLFLAALIAANNQRVKDARNAEQLEQTK